MSGKFLIGLCLLSQLCVGCAILGKETYLKGEAVDSRHGKANCGSGGVLHMGPSNGIVLRHQDRDLFVCSKGQTGKSLSIGPFLPFIPYWGFEWDGKYGWIKFGLKKENSWSGDRENTTTITFDSIEFDGDDDILISGHFDIEGDSVRKKKAEMRNTDILIDSGADKWIGFPAGKEIRMRFKVNGTDAHVIIFRPTWGLAYAFLSA